MWSVCKVCVGSGRVWVGGDTHMTPLSSLHPPELTVIPVNVHLTHNPVFTCKSLLVQPGVTQGQLQTQISLHCMHNGLILNCSASLCPNMAFKILMYHSLVFLNFLNFLLKLQIVMKKFILEWDSPINLASFIGRFKFQ